MSAGTQPAQVVGRVGERRDAGLIAAAETRLNAVLEIVCAALVVVETLILLVGVIWRYGLHRPLVWSDELAYTLFLWLGMLGAALAVRRSENLRMNTVVNLLPAGLRALAEPFALAVTLAFVVLLFAKGFSAVGTHDRKKRAIVMGALTGCFAIAVHSFVEFNLQVTANAQLFRALAALATIERKKHSRHEDELALGLNGSGLREVAVGLTEIVGVDLLL